MQSELAAEGVAAVDANVVAVVADDAVATVTTVVDVVDADGVTAVAVAD